MEVDSMEVDDDETIPQQELQELLLAQNGRIKGFINSSQSQPIKPPQIEHNNPQGRKEALEISKIEEAKYIQYSSLYHARFSLCVESVRKSAQMKWPRVSLCKRILDLKGADEQIIVGIVLKEMPLRPSILRETELIIGTTKVKKLFSEEEDFLAIEDPSGRVKVNSFTSTVISINHFIGGVTAAFKGFLDGKGMFTVNDYLFYQPDYSMNEILVKRITPHSIPSLTQMVFNAQQGNEMILFVSGLLFGSIDTTNGQLKLSRNLLINFIKGKLLVSDAFALLASKISKVIIVGNSISTPDEIDEIDRGSFRQRDINQCVYDQLSFSYEQLDEYINELAHYVPVDLMPGKSDHACSYFPSVPMTPVLFHESKDAVDKTLQLVTNPYFFDYKDISYIGTSGENIECILQATTYNEGLEVMKKTLEWGNIAPSAPDIQRCYSFEFVDPLVIKKVPNVYFCGNQSKYDTALYQYKGMPIRLLTIPDFSKTFSIALLDSITLDTCELSFHYSTD